MIAIAALFADLIISSRTRSLSEGWHDPSSAERNTGRQLRSLERDGWHVLAARAVPIDDEGVSDGRIDHLAIGPTGVYAIDSEKWDKRLPLRAQSHRKLYHGRYNQKERLDQARWEADQASDLISAQLGRKVEVQPSLAIYGPKMSWDILRVRDVDVYAGGRARRYLKRKPRVLTSDEIDRISRVAGEVLPPRYDVPAQSRGR